MTYGTNGYGSGRPAGEDSEDTQRNLQNNEQENSR